MPLEAATAPGAAADSAEPRAVAELLESAAGEAAARGRDDLAARLAAIRARVARTDTVVCVVGEFKQGKSALINALLATDVCPVDDDLATMAVTVVRHGDAAAATVRRREQGRLVDEAIDPAALPDWVTERGNRENHLAVELVEVAIPDPFLEQGVTLVDTPGVGGLNAAHAAATLAFLPVADALVFVTDASAELTAAELEFLAGARAAGRPILVALTKVDMYPQWRRILDINVGRLGLAGLDLRPWPLSSTLRAAARDAGDAGLEADSGYPPFARQLVGDVSRQARSGAVAGGLRELRAVLEQLRDPLAAELEALERPETAERTAADLREVRRRLAGLGGAGARWSARLDDEFEALRARNQFAFQATMRRILRDFQGEIEEVDPGGVWPDLSQRLQHEVASAVRDAFVDATDGAARAQAVVAGLLADEEFELDRAADPIAFDATRLWREGQAFGGVGRTGVVAGFGLLAGAAVGVDMLGMLGALLGTALVGPALLGAALFFGGREVVHERRRLLTERRQQARTFVAEFVDNVRFEVEGRLASLLAELEGQLRAHFAERIEELTRTYSDSAAAIERAAADGRAEAERRATDVRDGLARLAALATRADALEQTAAPAATA